MARDGRALEALDGGADFNAATRVRFSVNVYHRRIALHVFHCPPCQFRWKRKEYFDTFTDAEAVPVLEAHPTFG